MILVDTSVWVDHLRHGDTQLASLLDANAVVTHPFIVGEIACGSLSNRRLILDLIQQLPMSPVAEFNEVLAYIERQKLHGIGYVDVHLLTSAVIGGTRLWTRDKRLHAAADKLGYALQDAREH